MIKKKKRISNSLIIGVLLAIFVGIVLYNTIIQNNQILFSPPETCHEAGGFCTSDCSMLGYDYGDNSLCASGGCCMYQNPTELTLCMAEDGFCIPVGRSCVDYAGINSIRQNFGNPNYCGLGRCCGYTPEEPHALISYYEFENDVSDSGTNANHGTRYGISYVDGRYGKAASFDGTDDYIKLIFGKLDSIGSSSFTISTWVKIPTTFSKGVIFGNWKDSTSQNAFNLQIDNNGELRSFFDGPQGGDAVDLRGTTDLRDNQWHHVAVVRSKTYDEFYLYVDGRIDPISSGTNEIGNNIIEFQDAHLIGNDQTIAPPFFKGLIDDLRIYNYDLSEDDIEALALSCTTNNDCVEGLFCNGGICSPPWTKYPISYAGDFKDIFMIGEKAWAIDSRSNVMSSINGGQTWTPLQQIIEGFGLNSINVLNSNTGLIAGDFEGVLRTTDNWAHYTHIENNFSAGKTYDLFFLDSTKGWAVGEDLGKEIHLTIDGGQTWKNITNDSLNFDKLHSVFFINLNKGWAVGSGGLILNSSNGGFDWSAYDDASITQNLSSVYFISESNGFAVGDGGTILRTINGGKTWAASTDTESEVFNSVYFLGTTKGFVVGDSGAYYTTSDNGLHWEKIDLGATQNLNSVFFKDSANGLIVGDSGVVWKYDPTGTPQTQTTCYKCVSGSCSHYTTYGSCLTTEYASLPACEAACGVTQITCYRCLSSGSCSHYTTYGSCLTTEYASSPDCEADCGGLLNPVCAPWTQTNGTCFLNDTQVITSTSVDTSAICADVVQIIDCDYSDKGVISKENDVDTEEIDFELEIEGDNFASADEYEDELDLEIFDDDELIVEFEWDFDDEPLNLRTLYLEKQDSNDDFGFLIVNGLDVDKIFYIDVKDISSNAVCILDEEIDDIDDMTDDCDDTDDEEMIFCPGSGSGYTCSKINGSRFKISGLENSAVKEFTYLTSGGCTPVWTCGSWSDTARECGTRTCTDSNCDLADKQETKTCQTITPDECNSNSDCDYGERCSNGNCVQDSPTPQDSNWIWYLAIGVLGILVLAVIGLIIHHFMNKSGTEESFQPQHAQPRQQPPRTPPQNPQRRSY